MWLGMKFAPTRQDEVPRELLIAAGVLAGILGAIAALIIIFYTPSPRPSPFGCYQAAGMPLIRLSPDFILMPETAHPKRRVSFKRGNTGLSVEIFNDQPYAVFQNGRPVTPRFDLPPDEAMLLLDERRTTPTLLFNLNGASAAAPKVACPART